MYCIILWSIKEIKQGAFFVLREARRVILLLYCSFYLILDAVMILGVRQFWPFFVRKLLAYIFKKEIVDRVLIFKACLQSINVLMAALYVNRYIYI